MDYTSSFAISAAGMNLERTRVEVAALNLANAHTTAAPGTAAYRPLRVVAQLASVEGAVAAGQGANTHSAPAFDTLLRTAGSPARGVRPEVANLLPAAVLLPADAPARQVLEPGHPYADARGFVSYPAVDPATEMVTLMSATRAYEANVAAMNAARTMALKSLDIGGAA